MEELKKMTGQHFVVGFPETELDEEFIRLVKKYKIGNVILFRHNVESKEQLKALCGEIQELIQQETGHPAFIMIDQEGGVVTRLSEDFCNVPEEMALAASGDPENMKICAQITARQLLACGVNFNLAPVLDINNNAGNPVIGVRSYGDTPPGCGGRNSGGHRGIPAGEHPVLREAFPGTWGYCDRFPPGATCDQ